MRKLGTLAATCVATAVAGAANITYVGGDGDPSLPAAWVGGSAPGSGDLAFITGSGSWALTTTAPLAAGCASIYSGDGPLSIDLDTGSNGWTGGSVSDYTHPFVVNGAYENPVAATLRGVYLKFSALYLGYKVNNFGGKEYSNTSVEITGDGTTFSAERGDTVVGAGGTNNTLVVSDGAVMTSGRALTVGGPTGSGNLVRVTGAGTRFVARGGGDFNKIGNNGSHDNTVIVEQGARFEQTTSSHIAIGCGNGATRNAFIVRDGGAVEVSGAGSNFQLGALLKGETSAENHENLLAVSNASFKATGIYIGECAGSCSNLVCIGARATAETQSHIRLGNAPDSRWNELRVEGEGTVLSNAAYDVSVGRLGAENVFRVADGARAFVNRYLYVGGEQGVPGARGNVAEVSGAGSLVDVVNNITYVGYADVTGNVLRVTGGGCYTNHNNNILLGGANSCSNAIEVAGDGSRLYCGNYAQIGRGSNACHNRLRVSGRGYAEFARGFVVGSENGACSNVVEILDGAVVDTVKDYADISGWGTYFSTGPASTDAKYDDASIVGNGIIVSNAKLDASGSARAPELMVNHRGVGGYLKALDGAVVTPNQSFSLGLGSTNAAHGLIYAAGEGTVLSNKQYHLKVGYGTYGGHDNTVWIDSGAKMYIQSQMFIGTDGVPSATNNCLKIINGGFYNYSSQPMYIYNHGRLVLGGSHGEFVVSSLHMTNDGEIDFVFDADGIAACGPKYESYLLNNDWTPSVGRITIDATAYVNKRTNSKRTFTVFRSVDNRNIRTQSGTELSAQSADRIAAVNQAFRDRIVCTPAECVTVTKVDMLHSTIEVEVTPLSKGLTVFVR